MDIRIYQINDERDKENLRESTVKRMDQNPGSMKAIGIDASVYDKVFSGRVDSQTLAEVYDLFRYNPPRNYNGDTLCRSDVVEVVKDDASKFYFLASYGLFSISFDPSKTNDRSQEKKPMIELGLRLGVTLKVTPEELDKLGEDDLSAEQLLIKLIQSDRCMIGGDTYFPQPWNPDHLDDDLNFDLPLTPLHPQRKPSLDEKIQSSQSLPSGFEKANDSPEPER